VTWMPQSDLLESQNLVKDLSAIVDMKDQPIDQPISDTS